MSWITRVFRRPVLERQLDDELQDHVERLVADYRREGLPEAEARRRARLEFGGVDQVKEACRDTRGTRWLDEFVQDLRYGTRMLREHRGFTTVAILSLALGVGANTAIFSLVDRLLLRSLPVRAPEQLAVLDNGSWTHPIWAQIRDRQSSLFASAAAWSDDRFDLAPGGETHYVDGMWTSAGFFDTLGVPALLGRTFTPAEDRPGGGPDGAGAVISHRFWQRHFGGAANVIGRAVTLNRVPFVVVGVTPPSFFGPSVGRAFDVAVPIGAEPLVRGSGSVLDERSTWWLNIVVRLKPGQTLAQANAALRGVQPLVREATLPANWRAEDQARYLSEDFTLIPAATGISDLRDRYQRPLLVIMAVVVMVLLIACANIANLLVARGHARRHEFSLRLALGASRLRLARQLLTESLLLAVLGSALGLLVAYWSSDVLVRQLSTLRGEVVLATTIDWRTLGFTAAVAVGTALLFGIAPAARAGRVAPNEALKEQGRSLAGEGPRAIGSWLVVLQIALSLVLVVGAALFARTFSALVFRDLGFDRGALLVVNVDASLSGVDPAGRLALVERVRQAAASVPGAASAATSSITPMSGMGWNDRFEFPDRHLTGRQGLSWVNAVSPGWFATYGTALRAGRDFDDRDRTGTPDVVVVNEAFVRKFLPARDLAQAVGLTFTTQARPTRPAGTKRVIGVVENAAYRSPRSPLEPTVYLPLAQLPPDQAPPFASVTIRAATAAPAGLTRDVTTAMSRVDPKLGLTVQTLDTLVDSALAQERLVALLSAFFGGLALLLAAIGLYGVTSYAVNRRRTEIGIRMALGADAGRVVGLVVRRAALLVSLGVVVGAGLSLWTARFVDALLFGLQPRDPATLVGAALVLAAIGALATWLPARRATRIDPARVLREG